MVKRLFLLLMLLLPSAQANDYSSLNTRGKDGYRFEQKEWEMTEFTLRVFLARNREQMTEWREEAGIPNRRPRLGIGSGLAMYRTVAAFSKLRYNDKECDIYIYDPEYTYEPEFAGHELYHCIYGRWHTKQK